MRIIATIFINNILKQYKEQYYKTINKQYAQYQQYVITICLNNTNNINNIKQ